LPFFGQGDQRVVAAGVRGQDLVGHVAEQRAHLPQRVAGIGRRHVREQVLDLGRLGREAGAGMEIRVGDLGRRLLRQVGRQRQRQLRELDPERVGQVVDAIELPAPHARALSLGGADGEHQPIARLALVEDLLLLVRVGQSRAHAAALAGPARVDLELDAPQVLDVRRQHGKV